MKQLFKFLTKTLFIVLLISCSNKKGDSNTGQVMKIEEEHQILVYNSYHLSKISEERQKFIEYKKEANQILNRIEDNEIEALGRKKIKELEDKQEELNENIKKIIEEYPLNKEKESYLIMLQNIEMQQEDNRKKMYSVISNYGELVDLVKSFNTVKK